MCLDRKKHCNLTYDYRASKLKYEEFYHGYETVERLALLQAVQINEIKIERMGRKYEEIIISTNESKCANTPMTIIYFNLCYDVYNENIIMFVKTNANEWLALINEIKRGECYKGVNRGIAQPNRRSIQGNALAKTRRSSNRDYFKVHNYYSSYISLVISSRDDYAVIRAIKTRKQTVIFIINSGTRHKTVKGRSLNKCKKFSGMKNSNDTSSETMCIQNKHQQRQLAMSVNEGNYGNYGDFNASILFRKQIYLFYAVKIRSNKSLFETEKGRSLIIVFKLTEIYKLPLCKGKGKYKKAGNCYTIIETKYKIVSNEWSNSKHACFLSDVVSGYIRKGKGWSLKMVTKYAWIKLPGVMYKLCKKGIRCRDDNTYKNNIQINEHIIKHVKLGNNARCTRLKWEC